jgi:hypothetical protein
MERTLPHARMVNRIIVTLAFAGACLPAPSRAAGTAADSSAARDTTSARDTSRVVRTLEPIEARARLRDPRSTQTRHATGMDEVRDAGTPLLESVELRVPGMVLLPAGFSLRGGRPGEASTTIEDFPLDEPIRNRPMPVPADALSEAEVWTGAIDASQGATLAGTLRFVPAEPANRWSARASWSSDGGTDTHYDRGTAQLAGPLTRRWGFLAAGEGRFDDTSVPNLRSPSQHESIFGPLGWRADNHLATALRIGPVDGSGASGPRLQLLWARTVEEPFDAQWTVNSWVQPCNGMGCAEGPSLVPGPEPGAYDYNAADHVPITDDRRAAAYATWSATRGRHQGGITAGWTGSRRLTALGGTDDESYLDGANLPLYGIHGNPINDPFHAYGGDVPWFRREHTDTWYAQVSGSQTNVHGGRVRAGLGFRYDAMELRELDLATLGSGIDSLRAWRTFAPGAWAFAQGRWVFEEFAIEGGLRGEWFDPGHEAQPKPDGGQPASVVTWSPRVGIAYPISPRDAFSFAYARLRQAPPRDLLYDSRPIGDFRHPLGNSGLVPATAITYDAALQHVIGESWALQTSVFYRDWYDQPGARAVNPSNPLYGARYESVDEGHAQGFELALAWRPRRRAARADVTYTWMDARGSQSQSDGLVIGPPLGPRPQPAADRPLDWDARHTATAVVHWPVRRSITVDWSTLVRSGTPWTPRVHSQEFVDPELVNSLRLPWTESSTLIVRGGVPWWSSVTVGVEVQNVFDQRGPASATLDGYPNPTINTYYDDYGAFRTDTGLGGAYWNNGGAFVPTGWVRVEDPRLDRAPRTIRVRIDAAL